MMAERRFNKRRGMADRRFNKRRGRPTGWLVLLVIAGLFALTVSW